MKSLPNKKYIHVLETISPATFLPIQPIHTAPSESGRAIWNLNGQGCVAERRCTSPERIVLAANNCNRDHTLRTRTRTSLTPFHLARQIKPRRSRGSPWRKLRNLCFYEEIYGRTIRTCLCILVGPRDGRGQSERASVVDVVICMSANKKIKFVAMTDDSSMNIFKPKPKQ